MNKKVLRKDDQNDKEKDGEIDIGKTSKKTTKTTEIKTKKILIVRQIKDGENARIKSRRQRRKQRRTKHEYKDEENDELND